MIHFDAETCGFVGPAVLLQYAENDGPVCLHHVFEEPVDRTLALIEDVICPNAIHAFNLTFDWFHTQKLHSMLSLVSDKRKRPDVEELASLERRASEEARCVRPASALDLYLYARKGPYQSLMDRDDIRVRRVPAVLAEKLAEELSKRIDLPPIYFSRRKADKAGIFEITEDPDAPEWPDVVLRFGASAGLKALAAHVLGVDPTDFPAPENIRPGERGWCPFHDDLETIGDRPTWPHVIEKHVEYWKTDEALRYAANDIEYLRALRDEWGRPDPGDDDSELAVAVGCARWKGFAVDVDRCRELLDEVSGVSESCVKSPAAVRKYIEEKMDETERLLLEDTTKETLTAIASWGDHPAADRARDVIRARKAEKRAQILRKLIEARGLYPDMKVIGTLSGRMSGAGGLSAQGIPKDKRYRAAFPLAWGDETLEGGDFSGFEVTLADAVYNDPDLRRELKLGKKIHALFGASVYKVSDLPYLDPVKIEALADDEKTVPVSEDLADALLERFGMGEFIEDVPGDVEDLIDVAGIDDRPLVYQEVRCSDGWEKWDGYGWAKNGFFASLFGAMGPKLADTLKIAPHRGAEVETAFGRAFPVVGEKRAKIQSDFEALAQPGGPGTSVRWKDPTDYIESLFGFRRYFTLEHSLMRALFKLAESPPREWGEMRGIKVRRRDRVQTPGGATRSALYAAAFNIQARNQRAAGNHVIQSSGAAITKRLQRRAWDLQPVGVHEFIVRTLNVHDEVMAPTKIPEAIPAVVFGVVEEFRDKVPLIKLDWGSNLTSWADK